MNIAIPRLDLNRRRSTKVHTNFIFKINRRSQSIPIVKIHTPRSAPPMPTYSIEINVSIRDMSARDIHGGLYFRIWENSTENETKWIPIDCNEGSYRHNSLDRSFPYLYAFEKAQLIRVDIFHLSACSEVDVPVASTIFKVDELIGSFGLQIRKPLFQRVSIASALATVRPTDIPVGFLFITGKMGEKEQPLIVQLHGKGLERKDFLWDETAVFFRVFRLEEGEKDDSLVLLYESEPIKNHSHPQWAEFRLGSQDAADNRNRLLEVWVMYKDVDNTEGYIGKFLTTYAKMKYGPGPDNIYHVINEFKKQQKKSYEHSGKMELVKFTDVSFFSFLDYIVSGTQLHFELAVDFSLPESAHPIENRKFETDFQLAMRAVGGILRDYTPNRLFPAFGMGAKIPPTFHESNEFHLNFALDPACRGLDSVMDAYRKAQNAVSPLKEAKFAPMVQYATRMSQSSGFRGLHYHVLTVFARETPSDLKDLSVALQSVCDAPLSILFIGVGNADFSALQKVVMKRKDMKRDCVEFFQLSELCDSSDSPSQNKLRIAEQCLHNIPLHMVSYMHNNNIAAKPPIQVCRSPLFHSSSLIPDRPTQFIFDAPPTTPEVPSRRPHTDRRGSDSHYLEVDHLHQFVRHGLMTVRVPERSHSVLQTTREQYQRRLKERGLGSMKFPRVELSTLESQPGSTQESTC